MLTMGYMTVSSLRMSYRWTIMVYWMACRLTTLDMQIHIIKFMQCEFFILDLFC